MISRSRIVERLRKGTQGPLTVITGPPGAGKTMAVVSWATTAGAAPGPVAWVSLQQGDEHPETFWPMVVAAFHQAGVKVPWNGPDQESALTDLARYVAECGHPVVLLLDNLHVSHGSEVSRELARLLGNARPWLRLVVTARRDPPLPLHRYHLARELTEVRVEHLAFSGREAEQLLAQHKVRLTPASLRALLRRTEGWAAGLRLAAITLEGHPDLDGFVTQFTGDDKSVVAYLIEEVLNAQPDDRRRLLLATCVPDRVNAELAGELAGAEAGRSFAAMVDDNAFAIQLDHGWYRYHPMFAEALRLVLRHEAPGDLALLNRRAAAWFAREGSFLDAVRHAARARDWTYASRLIVDSLEVGQLLGLRPDRSLTTAMGAMPGLPAHEAMEIEPALVTAAVAGARGDEDACVTALESASRLIDRSPDAGALPARLAVGLIRLAGQPARDPDRSRTLDEVEALLQRLPAKQLEEHPEVGALVLGARGRLRLEEGRLGEAANAYGAAVTAALKIDGKVLRRSYLAYLSLIEGLRGRPARAAELAMRAEQLPERTAPPGAAVVHLASAWVALHQVEPVRLKHELSKAQAALTLFPDDFLTGLHVLTTAQAGLVAELPEQALDAARGAVRAPAWLRRRLALTQAEAHALLGQTTAAKALAGEPDGLPATMVLAHAAQRAGEHAESARAVRGVLVEPGALPADVRLDAWLLDACLSYQSGDILRGRRSLDRALRLGEREQLLLPFARSKSWLQPLLRHDPQLARPYLRFLARLHIAPQIDAASAEGVVYGKLSERELDVLRYLSKVMTTEEIAVQMYVSVNTVKTHLKSIYRKLAVTRRGEAVRRAKQLSLM
ncbi:LuxR family transcriptional regulator [Nonomuraea rosea]|uniref:LuxR family transcriptional regulator n=1 Tax=Nonomuraea rosea TaxID=638574 RepID=A0ABP6ZJZ9_9ACTN